MGPLSPTSAEAQLDEWQCVLDQTLSKARGLLDQTKGKPINLAEYAEDFTALHDDSSLETIAAQIDSLKNTFLPDQSSTASLLKKNLLTAALGISHVVATLSTIEEAYRVQEDAGIATLPTPLIETMKKLLNTPLELHKRFYKSATSALFFASLEGRAVILKTGVSSSALSGVGEDLACVYEPQNPWLLEKRHMAYFACKPAHPNLIAPLAFIRVASEGADNIGMILPQGETDLRSRVIESPGEPPLKSEEILSFAQQLASGLAHMHAHGIDHLDLKPDNIFLFPHPVIGDLGLSLDRKRHSSLADWRGSIGYIAPEMLKNGEVIDFARADLFSLGILFYELVTGRLFFENSDDNEWKATAREIENALDSRLKKPKIQEKFLKNDPKGTLQEVIRGCLKLNPSDRIPLQQILSLLHPSPLD